MDYTVRSCDVKQRFPSKGYCSLLYLMQCAQPMHTGGVWGMYSKYGTHVLNDDKGEHFTDILVVVIISFHPTE